MTIVFLTREQPARLFLINELHKSFPITKVFFQTKHTEPVSWGTRLERLLRDPTKIKNVRMVSRELVSSWLFRKESSAQQAYETEMFFNGSLARLDPGLRCERLSTFNSLEALDKVRKEQPDIILVFGTEILKGEILHVAKRGILNVHPAILPKYRGGGLPHWCLLQDDFANLGVTVHVCTTALDGGDIVGQKFLQLARHDRIYMMEYKTTVAALELLKEVLEQYRQGTVQYRPQPPAPVWRKKDLTLPKMLAARLHFNRHIRRLAAGQS